jgi:hypothetical protein
MALFHGGLVLRQDEGIMDIHLSIVIPAYNEALRIGKTPHTIGNYVRNADILMRSLLWMAVVMTLPRRWQEKL